jgi:hypothetical protein
MPDEPDAFVLPPALAPPVPPPGVEPLLQLASACSVAKAASTLALPEKYRVAAVFMTALLSLRDTSDPRAARVIKFGPLLEGRVAPIEIRSRPWRYGISAKQ